MDLATWPYGSCRLGGRPSADVSACTVTQTVVFAFRTLKTPTRTRPDENTRNSEKSETATKESAATKSRETLEKHWRNSSKCSSDFLVVANAYTTVMTHSHRTVCRKAVCRLKRFCFPPYASIRSLMHRRRFCENLFWHADTMELYWWI